MYRSVRRVMLTITSHSGKQTRVSEQIMHILSAPPPVNEHDGLDDGSDGCVDSNRKRKMRMVTSCNKGRVEE